jgi:DNA-binding IclR family transcriptional regulator
MKAVGSVNKMGFASANSELAEGLEAVAVPIPLTIFGVPAGLGCSGPAEVMANRDDLAQVLLEVAKDVRLT